MNIRNIAIIAHVDHGKTTLVDQLLKQSDTLKNRETISERVMDNNAIEKERGITILAKNTAIYYKDYKINILDTPGHSDFSGEVERILKMVDGVLLVVDAFEGCMPQTRFVLSKALEYNLKPIVVINKIDREFARPNEVLNEVFDLFIDLKASDEQIDFKSVFVSATLGTSSLNSDIKTQSKTMAPLLDLIIKEIPFPKVKKEGGMQFQGALLDYNDYVGRMAIGRIERGTVKVNEMVCCLRNDGSRKEFRIQKLYSFLGLKKIEVEEAYAGDIVAISGLSDINVGETVCEIGIEEALSPIKISEPTVEMLFSVSTSPFAGKEGKFVTSTKIDDRLNKETQKDVSLKVKRIGISDEWLVLGRGELHLGILIEQMRREGFEFQVSKPKPILKEKDGVLFEPYEYAVIDTPNDTVGSVIELLGNRGGALKNMSSDDKHTKLVYSVPSRGLIGFMTDFMTVTKGYGTLSHVFEEYKEVENINYGSRKLGVLVSTNQGRVTAYGISQVEDRGVFFVEPNDEVYEGQIVGECNKDDDLAVNITKAKQMTNMRSATKDSTVVLKRAKKMSLEACLDYINDDELLEITPKSIRLRKKILNTVERKKFDSRKSN
ncbi:MAG: translational GTPase TypA [Bacilli bacterium]|jgi:GTP-binding protein